MRQPEKRSSGRTVNVSEGENLRRFQSVGSPCSCSAVSVDGQCLWRGTQAVGTRFVYEGETVEIVELIATPVGNVVLVKSAEITVSGASRSKSCCSRAMRE